MNISTLFARKKQRISEKIKPIRERYLGLVRRLAAGAEIDEEEVFATTDELGIDEAKLSSDVSTMTQRLADASAVERNREALLELDRLARLLGGLTAEKESFFKKWSPRWDAESSNYRTAEAVVLATSHAEHRLVESVLDPAIIDAQAALSTNRRELHETRLRLADAIRHPTTELRRAKIDEQNAELEIERVRFPDARKRVAERQAEATARISQWQPEVRRLEREIASVDQQFRELDAKQRDLDLRKLVP
jgi:regulator of replication initiation timing